MMDWIWADGRPTSLCPRTELKRQVAIARDRGFDPVFALEIEFFLLPRAIEDVRAGGWNGLDVPTRDIHCYEVFLREHLTQLPAVAEVHSRIAITQVKYTTAIPLEVLTGED